MSCCVASHAELETQLAETQKALSESRQELATTQEALAQELATTQEVLAKAEQELRELVSLRHCIDAANAPIVAVDRSGFVTLWNQKAEEVFQCPRHSALRRSLADFLHKDDDRENFIAAQAFILAQPAPPPEGLNRTHVQQRDVTGALFIGQDISELSKTAEAELAVQDLTRLIRTVNAPIIGVDPFGCIEDWNNAAELLTGFTKEEAIGKHFAQHFITEEEFADSVQSMLSLVSTGQEITNYEFSLWTKGGQRKEILWSATVGFHMFEALSISEIVNGTLWESLELGRLRQDLRSCGLAFRPVYVSRGWEIEHLISQQAQMGVCDPRMVLWRASFVSILKTMCQNFWMRRKEVQGSSEKTARTEVFTTDFGYEFCFEAPNGSVKWYKVQGHLIQECTTDSQFEISGSMHEVTSMLIDKVMGDRWQKWWSRMCHMVFDATLLVDTQEYRVLNSWGEEKVFGCKLQSHHPLLQLIKPEDTVKLKEAFNEVTFKGFERGRTLHLISPGSERSRPAQCFLLSADQENPNECMMGIRMQVTATDDNVSVLWDVAKPCPKSPDHLTQ
ncbi:unnamed protein product, partial [Polarella glacialis]